MTNVIMNPQEGGVKDSEVTKALLDSYFGCRSPHPEQGYTQQNRTTLDITDDLMPMKRVDGEEVNKYMMEHGYDMTTEADGSVSWAIWRRY